ncbi:MAG: ArsR family transcriptional regulator [Candidatus Hydrogenedentota bacterium]
MFIDRVFGNDTAEPVLLYLQAYEKGYAKEISRTFGIPLNMVQKQLIKFEAASVLVSQKFGSVRLFSWNPRWPFLVTFRSWLQEVLAAMPKEMRERYYTQRKRPRRTGKPVWLKSTKPQR